MLPREASVNELVPGWDCGVPQADAELRRHFVPMVLLADELLDTLVAMRPVPPKGGALRPDFFPGKRFALDVDGALAPGKDMPFNRAQWFIALMYAFDGIDSMHGAFERIRTGADSAGAPAYVVSGQVACEADPRGLPRTKSAKAAVRAADGRVTQRGAPQGLADEFRRWLVADMDKIPNLLRLDPRRDPEPVVAWLRGLLPPTARGTRCSWQISASCCVKGGDGRPLPADVPPATLGMHLRFVLDEALDEAGRAALLEDLRRAVVAELLRRGAQVSPELRAVDPAVATYNQPIFPCASFEGLPDPIPVGHRSGLVPRGNGEDVLRVAALRAELPPAPGKEKRRPAAAANAEEKAAERRIRTERRAHDRLLRGAARLAAAEETAAAPAPQAHLVPLRPQHPPAGRGKAAAIYRAQLVAWQRALGDVVALVDHRRQAVAGWQNGVPEGARTLLLLQVSAALAHLVPADRLRDAIRAYGLRLTSAEWFATEWLAAGKENGIVQAAEWAATAAVQGGSTKLMAPYLARFTNLLRPTTREQAWLGLQALRDEAERSRDRRRKAGALPAEIAAARRAQNSEKALQPWVAEGISESTYRRRKRAARAAAVSEAVNPETAMLSAAGRADVLAVLDIASTGSVAAARQLAEGPCAGLDLVRLAEGAAPIHEALYRRGDERAATVARQLAELADAAQAGEGSAAMLRYVLGPMGYLEWAAVKRVGEAPVVSVAALLAQAAAHPHLPDFLAVAARETPLTVGATGIHGGRGAGEGGGQTPRYPGRAVAGVSRATWFRRLAAERVRETDLTVDATETHVEQGAGAGQGPGPVPEFADEDGVPW